MNIKNQINLDPHLALKLIHIQSQVAQLPIVLKFKKLALLSKTRRFQQLQNEVDNIKQIGYPTLKQSNKLFQKGLIKAAQTTQNQQNQLGGNTLLQALEDIEQIPQVYDQKTEELFQKAYKLSRIYYEKGQYQDALDLIVQLDYFIEKDKLWLPVTWGRLCTQILLNKTENAKDTVKRLKNKIDDYRYKSVQKSLAQKESFLNTCCFVFFQSGREEDLETFIDICTSDEYFSTIQMTCPYIFRYLCCAMILNKTCQKYGNFDLYRLIDSINRNLFKYSDSVVEFLRQLQIKFDFTEAANALKKVRQQLKNDYFLGHIIDKIQQSSYFLYYETYCKIHETLKIDSVSQFLKKDQQEAELWIINLIRRSGISAKIDSVTGVIRISKTFSRGGYDSKYAQLIPRTNTIVSNLSRILNQN